MRIQVLGSCNSAVSIANYLRAAGVLISNEAYNFTVEAYDAETIYPIVDGVDCRLEALIVSRISDLAETRVILDRGGPNRSDMKIVIGIPSLFSDSQKSQVERGIMQAVVQFLAAEEKKTYPDNISALAGRLEELAGELDSLKDSVNKLTAMQLARSPWWKFW